MEHWNNVKRDDRFQRISIGMELQTKIRILCSLSRRTSMKQHHIVSETYLLFYLMILIILHQIMLHYANTYQHTCSVIINIILNTFINSSRQITCNRLNRFILKWSVASDQFPSRFIWGRRDAKKSVSFCLN